jgi:hypothetical protein
MSFTFGNTSVRIAGVELFAIPAQQRHAAKMEFLNQWHSTRALVVDFAKLGVDPMNIPAVDLSDCSVDYEYADDGHIVFLTTYVSDAAMQKDMELIEAARSVGACQSYGRQVAITMDADTGAAFRRSLIKAIKARRAA